RRPPRDARGPLFSPAMIAWSVFQGGWVLLVTTAVFVEAIARGLPDGETRALVFVALVVCNSLLIFVNRSYRASVITALVRPNLALWIVLAATAILLALSLSITSIRELFTFAPLSTADFARVLAAAVATIAPLEIAKTFSGTGSGGRRKGATLQ
ncbi:MAG TPA: cation-translocating P-type ATPase C-terminal domain-containing protein, partial [Candidatus Binataceae bacterium]|nr:cation-translocating P-type ATPase C-terminal domain-containing protein [Candidatus Binataceae bacterium]